MDRVIDVLVDQLRPGHEGKIVIVAGVGFFHEPAGNEDAVKIPLQFAIFQAGQTHGLAKMRKQIDFAKGGDDA